MKKSLYLFCCILLCFTTTAHSSACCGVSSSISANGIPLINKGSILLWPGYNFTTTQSNGLLKHDASFVLAYGLTNKLSVMLGTKYSWLEASQIRNGLFDTSNGIIDTIRPDTMLTFNNQGLGDGIAGIQYIFVVLDGFTKQELKAGVNVGLPWGDSNKESMIDGMKMLLPAKAQTGTGSYSLVGYASYDHSFLPHTTDLSASFSGKLNFKNKKGQKPGNVIGISVSAIKGPVWKFKGVLSCNYSLSESSLDEFKNIEKGTGGQRLDFSSGIEFEFTDSFKSLLNLGFPLWRDTNQKINGSNFTCGFQTLFFIPVLRN